MILIIDTITKEILYTMKDNDWEFLIYPKNSRWFRDFNSRTGAVLEFWFLKLDKV